MKNKNLAHDYIQRATHRLASIEVLFERKSWADVVREAQEAVELALKALLRISNIEVPRIHDVGNIILEHSALLPKAIHGSAEALAKISHSLRRDRELAFYGSEDLTPSEFYKEEDAKEALDQAKQVISLVSKVFKI